MESTWLHCEDCLSSVFVQRESVGDESRICDRCGSAPFEYGWCESRGPAGGGEVGYGPWDPDRVVISMIRKAFGPDVTEIDADGREIQSPLLAA
jgi:hypothetical protein